MLGASDAAPGTRWEPWVHVGFAEGLDVTGRVTDVLT